MITNDDSGELRIGDAEREAAAEQLGEHFRAGRLSPGEYDERVTEVWTARTRSALVPLFLDLPGGAPAPAPAVLRPEQRHRRPGPRPWVLVPVILLIVGSIVFGALTHDHDHGHHPPILAFALLWFAVFAVRRRAWAHGARLRGPRGRW